MGGSLFCIVEGGAAAPAKICTNRIRKAIPECIAGVSYSTGLAMIRGTANIALPADISLARIYPSAFSSRHADCCNNYLITLFIIIYYLL